MGARGRSIWRVDAAFEGLAGLDWTRELLDGYDLSMLSRLTVRDGSERKGAPSGVWGTCYYATQKIPTYRITCSLKRPFPAAVHIRRSPLYAREDGSYLPTPHGLVTGQEFVSRRGGKVRRWIRLYGKTELRNADEALVWILSHEAYHYLRRTRQVPGRNAEIEADRCSDEALGCFREGLSPARFRTLQEARAGHDKGKVGRRG